MLPRVEFVKLVAGAYQQLYDLVRLRSHALIEALGLDADAGRKEQAWQLHHYLLRAIEELDPGPQAPAYSHEWCRYRLMRLRYVNGADPPEVAHKLAISRRQYYREHDAAMEAIAELLWQRCAALQQQVPEPHPAPPEPHLPSRQELLRQEAERASLMGRSASIGEVATGVLATLEAMLREHTLLPCLDLPEALPDVAVDRGLLRQLLLAMLGYLAEHARQGDLRLIARVEGRAARLRAMVDPALAHPMVEAEMEARIASLRELAAVSGVSISPLCTEQAIYGFDVQLPLAPQRTILVVDDNLDVVELFQRYLSRHNYLVVPARTASEGLALAQQLQPQAITLDLMMPEQDGWEALQSLLNRPDTRDIPIIVCSVLRENDLALSLGASAFLEKPVTEDALLATLRALEAI